MIKNQAFNYYSTQWNAQTCLFVGEYSEMISYISKRFKYSGTDAQNPNFAAESFTIVGPADDVIAYVVWMPWFTFTIEDYVTLSHELLHTVTHILDDRNVFYGDSSKEALTYSFDDFYKKYLCLLQKERKKHG